MVMCLGLSSGSVILYEEHPAWALAFKAAKSEIQNVIGANIVKIEHVGSTSIPGVPAKPILDIAIAVENIEGSVELVEPMQALGYQHRGEYGIPRRRYFVRGDPRTHHVHMLELSSGYWKTMIAFRELLRTDSRLAQRYASAKRGLAIQFAQDRDAYQKAKNAVVEQLLQRLPIS